MPPVPPKSGPRSLRGRGGALRAATVALTVTLAALATVLAGCTHSSTSSAPAPTQLGPGATPSRPNIVLVLTDDLSWNLVQYMPHVVALEHRGMTFTNYTVADSLCCPSRASIFTGEYPHNTHVLTNDLPDGGFGRFYQLGEEKHTFATTVQRVGYRTGFMGKYLNQFDLTTNQKTSPTSAARQPGAKAYVPPGWTQFNAINSGGYGEFGYKIIQDHRITHRGTAPQDYATTVIKGDAQRFAAQAMQTRWPFLLEAATFAPHAPYVPAPVDKGSFLGLTAPRDASFGKVPTEAPAWMRQLRPFGQHEEHYMNFAFERRVESVQAVDRMLGALEHEVAAHHQTNNTVFVFSSDNGYHIGEHGLLEGKQTAFDTDIRVPLIVAGPGVRPDSVNTDLVQNVDLAPTLDALAGGATPPGTQASLIDGHSFVPLLHGQHVPWRTLSLVEHHGDNVNPADPDYQSMAHGNPPSYDALRGADFTYVRYDDPAHPGEREYYDLKTDPLELHNAIATLSPQRIKQLDAELDAYTGCHGPVQCWDAGHPALDGGVTVPGMSR